MTDPTDHDAGPESYADLPMQPTGSGVADLEVAYEQMKLAEDVDPAPDTMPLDRADGAAPDETSSEAHPS